MTLKKSLEAVAAAAVGVVLDAALALACLRFHLDWQAVFWFVLLLVSVASLVDATRKRRTILRGGTVSLPPSRNNDSLVAWISMSVVCWTGVMLFITTQLVNWVMAHTSPPSSLEWYGSISAGWIVLIALQCWAESKKRYLWSRPFRWKETDPEVEGFYVPPLTLASLRGPAIYIFWMVNLVTFLWTSVHTVARVVSQSFDLHWFLAAITLSTAIAAALVVIYVALVTFLTSLNNRAARLRQKSAYAGEDVWPPPPLVNKESGE